MENNLLARVLGVARTVTPVTPVTAAELALPHLQLGQAVRAQVAARLGDGSFRVIIDDAPIELALPAQTKPGDSVSLRLVARTPRLEFELLRPSVDAHPRLSSGARLIGQVLSESAQSPPQQARPVTATPSADPEQLREPLARAVQRSGLFYEAHQARWIRGDYPLELLREEPQAAIAARSTAEESKQAQEASRSATNLPLRLQPTASPDETIDSAEVPGANRNSAGILDGDDRAPALLPREAMPIVRQQLEALETRHIVWQGELWPGQSLHWEIAEQQSDAQQPHSENEWQTRLALRLPALGEINAQLALGAHGVRIAFTAPDADAVALMRARAPELVHALAAAGLDVATLDVRQHERD
jgi:hypothetical protein